jgi:hypothetical protein
MFQTSRRLAEQAFPDYDWDEFRDHWNRTLGDNMRAVNDFMNNPRNWPGFFPGGRGLRGAGRLAPRFP